MPPCVSLLFNTTIPLHVFTMHSHLSYPSLPLLAWPCTATLNPFHAHHMHVCTHPTTIGLTSSPQFTHHLFLTHLSLISMPIFFSLLTFHNTHECCHLFSLYTTYPFFTTHPTHSSLYTICSSYPSFSSSLSNILTPCTSSSYVYPHACSFITSPHHLSTIPRVYTLHAHPKPTC